ncbi:hypothetical protein KOW79_021337 [Hemibagrus wyckioides]|uniref:Ig-like domain-containing protein n=1 Tax=Hemibagrus wyckioides TaxID=337641 RepID=A0A9D3N3D4_9TELE|nr:hypothetical protein KOW79_021337 [Hemibagrus wyckioides]
MSQDSVHDLERLNNIQEFRTNNESDKVDEKFPLIASSGFFRCVTALDSGFLYPFKPSPNTVTSYIVAPANESITTKSVERSSVELTEGEDVLLNCSFIFTERYNNEDFSVYWIKTIEKNTVVVVRLWKKNKTSPRSQTMELQTIQHRDET